MHFVYIDDSGDGTVACFSALIIPADQWRSSLDHLLGIRRMMSHCDGIRMKAELHSTDWLGGKGALARVPISKPRRARLYDFFLAGISMIPGAQLINAVVPDDQDERAFEFLLNRINTNMRKAGSSAVVFCDEGKSYDSIRRKLGVFNHIPSKRGNWVSGTHPRISPRIAS